MQSLLTHAETVDLESVALKADTGREGVVRSGPPERHRSNFSLKQFTLLRPPVLRPEENFDTVLKIYF